jgi:predicted RNase H-like HicB family nuclease
MRIFLTIKTWKEGQHYVAYTPELDVSSQGKSSGDAEKRLQEAIDLFLDETKRLGTFHDVLGSVGFLRKDRHWIAPQVSLSFLEVSA